MMGEGGSGAEGAGAGGPGGGGDHDHKEGKVNEVPGEGDGVEAVLEEGGDMVWHETREPGVWLPIMSYDKIAVP